jgi:hypothetical protein
MLGGLALWKLGYERGFGLVCISRVDLGILGDGVRGCFWAGEYLGMVSVFAYPC